MAFKRQALVKLPPKNAFQMLCDITIIEDVSSWKVHSDDDGFGEGTTWTEKRFLRKRTWKVVAYDRRAWSYTAEWNGVRVTFVAKKGGTWSSNLQMNVEGEPHAVARFEKTDGDRLDRIQALVASGN